MTWTVHNTDAHALMRTLSDASVDALITDPPYGMNYQSGRSKDGPRFDVLRGDDAPPLEFLSESVRVLRRGGCAFVFCEWRNAEAFRLDRLCTRIVEFDRGKLFEYDGGYRSYLVQRADRLERESKHEQSRLNTLRRETEWVKRGPPARTTKAKARIDRHAALLASAPAPQPSELEFVIPDGPRLGDFVLRLRGVGKKFGERTILRPFDLELGPGQRLGIVGRNGVGKTTLLKLCLGQLQPDQGQVAIGPASSCCSRVLSFFGLPLPALSAWARAFCLATAAAFWAVASASARSAARCSSSSDRSPSWMRTSPLPSRCTMRVAMRSRNQRSWLTTIEAPPNASSASSSARSDARSRSLVGSSSTSTLPPAHSSLASSTRLRSPPDRLAMRACFIGPGNRNCPDELVVDPFAGSGTTGVACVQLGRRVIVGDIDENYASLARARMQAAENCTDHRNTRQGGLFGG